MSLSSEPAFSVLKNDFVCGVKDISGEPYAGMSNRHDRGHKAVDTTNGAGPHNVQLFVLAPDGTVLNCMPGYWNSQDLVTELRFAEDLNKVWQNGALTRAEKDAKFRQMHLAHIGQHSAGMVRRSRMQGFDQQYEAENRPNSDTIKNKQLALASYESTGRADPRAFKTTDEIMHERIAQQPFKPLDQFNIAAFVDYGKPKYDKHEDYRTANGEILKDAARQAPEIGAAPQNQPRRRQRRWNPPADAPETPRAPDRRYQQGYTSRGNAHNSVKTYHF